ncbi:MAG: 2-amino-4-hydroxy-6-hydroxymethyldihydropteridine diphosphokinase [Proteobacteria bacterium]|nr:2-amino-4-hydroxy-6-hydroxymethyldihydropteridine diphosphokinase [Pseudomonadota bacterium]
MEQKAFIGIGSNIGNITDNCKLSIMKLAEDKRVRLISISSLYSTSPVSTIEQNNFINCATCVMWNGSPFDLLRFLSNIEKTMGRKRVLKNGPRIIDLDILLFGDLVLDTPLLKIPHPELHKRKFAIIPCIEIEPAIVHPIYGKQLKEFLSDIGDEQNIEMIKSPDFPLTKNTCRD